MRYTAIKQEHSYMHVLFHVHTHTHTYLGESQVHLEFCYPPADAAPDAVAERNGAKIFHSIQSVFTEPAFGTELFRFGKILLIHGGGVMTKSQLSLK